MNEWDILEQLGEIDSDLLAVPKPRKKHWGGNGRRIVLAAAVMMLLAGMALAVTSGVRAKYDEKMIQLQGISFDENSNGAQMYYTAQVEYDLCCVQVKNLPWLTQQLTQAWKTHAHEKSYLRTVDLMKDDGTRLCFSTIGEAESFFGIDLMQSAELEELVRAVYVSLAVTQPQRAKTEFEENNTVTPDGMWLYCSLKRGGADGMLDGELVSECGIEVFIALQENYAKTEDVKCLYSHENEGDFRESGMLTQQEMPILLLENTPRKGYARVGYAAWCKNGIGYLAHIKVYPDSYATALTILTPVLYRMN